VYASSVTSKAFRDRLARRTRTAGISASSSVVEQLEAYFRLLARWNAKVNLTSLPLEEPTDETFDRLLLEPLAAARVVEDVSISWFDVGSGGGSPAIPLKLVRPALGLTMVESKARKAAFLREVVRELALSGAVVETSRFEEVAARPAVEGSSGLVTLRAVRPDEKLMSAIARVLQPGGRLLMFRPTPQLEKIGGFELPGSAVLSASRSRPAYVLTYKRA
jgi:16S rRNA (guanine527-N7)-methyltransferase